MIAFYSVYWWLMLLHTHTRQQQQKKQSILSLWLPWNQPSFPHMHTFALAHKQFWFFLLFMIMFMIMTHNKHLIKIFAFYSFRDSRFALTIRLPPSHTLRLYIHVAKVGVDLNARRRNYYCYSNASMSLRCVFEPTNTHTSECANMCARWYVCAFAQL